MTNTGNIGKPCTCDDGSRWRAVGIIKYADSRRCGCDMFNVCLLNKGRSLLGGNSGRLDFLGNWKQIIENIECWANGFGLPFMGNGKSSAQGATCLQDPVRLINRLP